jgi:sulfite dehydrogenase (quinone) subunit SoeC
LDEPEHGEEIVWPQIARNAHHLALLFPLPALLLTLAPDAYWVFCAAFLMQYAGLLAERWYFFAEAKHPQNLYYQAIS